MRVIAAAMGLISVAAPPALAAGAPAPEWCRQNPSLTMDDYTTKIYQLGPIEFWSEATDEQVKSKADNELFREIPKDVIIIPENVEYITLRDVSIDILPVRAFKAAGGILPMHMRFTDVCEVVGPWGNALLVINENGYLRYIDAGRAQTAALYDAEMRLQQKFRHGADTVSRK